MLKQNKFQKNWSDQIKWNEKDATTSDKKFKYHIRTHHKQLTPMSHYKIKFETHTCNVEDRISSRRVMIVADMDLAKAGKLEANDNNFVKLYAAK